MILDALHSIISPIVDAYPMIGEYDAEIPFACFQAEPTPIRTKDGIIGYTQKVSVYLIDDDMDRLQQNANLIEAALLGMNGTIEGTTINSVEYTGETGIQFDKVTTSYQNSLEFEVDSDNR